MTSEPLALIYGRRNMPFGWEFGTLHMEMRYLSELTGDPTYIQKVIKMRRVLQNLDKPMGLYPSYLHPRTAVWGRLHVGMAGLGDSSYEYLVKEYLRSGSQDSR